MDKMMPSLLVTADNPCMLSDPQKVACTLVCVCVCVRVAVWWWWSRTFVFFGCAHENQAATLWVVHVADSASILYLVARRMP